MYDSLLIDQSLGMNRRCDDEKDVKTEVSSDRELFMSYDFLIQPIVMNLGLG